VRQLAANGRRKYKRLMKIEAELGAKATFKGMDAYPLAST